MKKRSTADKAVNQRVYRERVKKSVIVLRFPLHEDVVREWLVRAGVAADLADHDRQKAGEVLAEFWENHEG